MLSIFTQIISGQEGKADQLYVLSGTVLGKHLARSFGVAAVSSRYYPGNQQFCLGKTLAELRHCFVDVHDNFLRCAVFKIIPAQEKGHRFYFITHILVSL